MSFKSSLLKSIRPPWYLTRSFTSSETERIGNYAKKLSETLDCSFGTASLMVTRNKKILNSDLKNVQKVGLFCSSNFLLSEVIEQPEILSLSPYVLKDRTLALKELGCRPITTGTVIYFKYFIQGTPSNLHGIGFKMNPETYFAHTLNQLKCPDDVKLQMTSKLLNLCSENLKLVEMKALINAKYLAWKLEYSEEKVMGALNKCPALGTKSLTSLENIYDLLRDKFQLPISKVRRSLSLLALDYDMLEELLTKVPVICGVSIQHVAKQHPLVLKKKADSLIDILQILESHDIASAQLLSCPKILDLSASTILSRLNALKNKGNYKALREDERYLWLAYHFGNVREKSKLIEVLQSSKIPVSLKSLHSFNNERSNFKDICFYLAVVFNNSIENIKKELKLYPTVYAVSAGNARKIVEYLTAQGITKEQLWNGIGIVLYDAEVVIEYFKALPNKVDLQPPFSEWIGHPNLIQLLIYEAEKEQKFTGNGIYMRSTDNENESSENEQMLQDEEDILAICTEGGVNNYVYNINDL